MFGEYTFKDDSCTGLCGRLRGAPLSKDAVSRLVGRLRDEFDAWSTGDLAAEEVCYIFMDGIRVCTSARNAPGCRSSKPWACAPCKECWYAETAAMLFIALRHGHLRENFITTGAFGICAGHCVPIGLFARTTSMSWCGVRSSVCWENRR